MAQVSSTFHPGEIEVQRRAGVRDEADEVGGIIGASMPPALAPLLSTFEMAVAASIDASGRVWASLLTGAPGFLGFVDETRLHVTARPEGLDPLLTNLAGHPGIGLLIIDLATRRRLRINGQAVPDPGGGGFSVATEQVYGNCRKYIQRRRLMDPPGGTGRAAPDAAVRGGRSSGLTARQQKGIAAADTFFIASAHPEGGADASHRGGRPGFVRVIDARRLSFPDYPGNNMFNTLGNLTGDPRAGLLFLDFESGGLLQLTGRARVVWDPEAVAAHRGARHAVVEYEIDEVLETPAREDAPRWTLLESSPHNP